MAGTVTAAGMGGGSVSMIRSDDLSGDPRAQARGLSEALGAEAIIQKWRCLTVACFRDSEYTAIIRMP